MEARRLLDRFEKASPRNAKRLRNKIKDDVDQRKFEEGKPLCFMLFHCYSILLIPLDKYPDEFRHLYSDAIFDLDMKDDLERSNVINWSRTLRPLYPVKTTADGNCLANAVSQAMWGIEDSEAFLRRLLYVTMTTDPKGRFKRRWLIQQRYATEEIGMGLRLNTDQYNNEWDTVIRATTDIGNVENQGMPYTFLESIHLYILSNILRRPIILLADNRARNLLGESMQENDIGGIYLPLEWNHAECQKNPIVIGYNMNHFAPLIGQEKDNTNKAYACPIVTHELQSLKIHFLLPGEESNVGQLLMRYLKIEEVVHTDGMSTILCARMTHCDLPEDMNMIQAHRKDCERKFRHQVDEEAGHRVQTTQSPRANVAQPPRATVVQLPRATVAQPPRATVLQPPRATVAQPPNATLAPHPFEFQVLPPNNVNIVPPNNNINTVRQERKPGTVKVVQQPGQTVPSRSEKRKRCSVVGCKMYGSPEFNGLCSKCFNDFTIQYAQGEAMSRQRRDPRQNIVPQTNEPAPMYNDLSIMGENCQTGCGFRCSTETYPYCHECYPKIANQITAPVVARPIAEDVQLSVMPERCQEPNCTYRASTNTFPYCHQCFEKHVPKAEPTAPPVSVPVEVTEPPPQVNDTGDEILQLRIQEEPETNLIEIRQAPDPGSYPGFSHAVTGAQHMPMDTLPASGSGALNRKCKTGGCLNNAIRGNDGFCDQCYDQSLFGAGDFEAQGNVVPNLKRRTTCRSANCSEAVATGCDFCLECFLKDGTLPSATEREIKEMQVDNQPAELKDTPILVPQQPVGVTTVNLPQSTNLAKSRNETHRKYICAKAGCEGIRIDNNTGLCYDCSKVTNQTQVVPQQPNDLNRKSNLDESDPYVSSTPCNLSEAEKKELFPIVTSSKQKVKCAAAICNNMIYPPSKLCEDCTIAIEKSVAEKLKSDEYRHTAPIASNRTVDHSTNHQRHTVPIAKLHAKLCIEKDCERYGDPAQKDRCSRHYNLAMQRFRQPSPPLGHHQLTKQLNDEVARHTNRNIPLNVPVAQAPVPVENGDQLTAVMNRIENTRKSRSRCKNNTRTGCVNYGNASKGGYCNQCFSSYSAQTLVGHTPLPGLNQFD